MLFPDISICRQKSIKEKRWKCMFNRSNCAQKWELVGIRTKFLNPRFVPLSHCLFPPSLNPCPFSPLKVVSPSFPKPCPLSPASLCLQLLFSVFQCQPVPSYKLYSTIPILLDLTVLSSIQLSFLIQSFNLFIILSFPFLAFPVATCPNHFHYTLSFPFLTTSMNSCSFPCKLTLPFPFVTYTVSSFTFIINNTLSLPFLTTSVQSCPFLFELHKSLKTAKPRSWIYFNSIL